MSGCACGYQGQKRDDLHFFAALSTLPHVQLCFRSPDTSPGSPRIRLRLRTCLYRLGCFTKDGAMIKWVHASVGIRTENGMISFYFFFCRAIQLCHMPQLLPRRAKFRKSTTGKDSYFHDGQEFVFPKRTKTRTSRTSQDLAVDVAESEQFSTLAFPDFEDF